jgi:hypothetical protein
VSRLFPERAVLGLAPASIGEPWEDAIARLAPLDKKRRTTVVLSNHFVRYAVVPWSEGLDSPAEEQAYVRHHFARIHGERAKAWALRWCDNGDTRLASAIDQPLLEALKQVLPRLVSVQPYLMAAINRCRAAIPKSGAWLALVEQERACIALHAGGRWRSVQNARGAWLDLLERERHRAEGTTPDLALVEGARAESEIPGWTFRELQPVL